jgi:Armadillo/beta-catenin-like repeat
MIGSFPDRCLANLATGDHSQTFEVSKTVPTLLGLLASGSYEVKEQVCWVLGNIAGDCDECRRQIYLSMTPLVHLLLLQDSSVELLKCKVVCAWAISNLMRGSTPVSLLLDTGTALICLYYSNIWSNSITYTGRITEVMRLVEASDSTLRTEIAWIFAFTTAKDDAPLQEFISKGLFEVRSKSLQPNSTRNIRWRVILESSARILLQRCPTYCDCSTSCHRF